ncbi:MAG TPA: class I SAM-dependent methyltransferase, partial [Polyangia bacterium]|nr:class I SAM-dependent methyltransferase [Polyangia bacterium]
VEFLNRIRTFETARIAAHLQPGARILEIGAGTGRQALDLAARGFSVDAIEIQASNYAGDRLFPITEYDGRHIPFPDATFDIVFSSNVLEHVTDLPQLHAEIRRTLRRGGYCVHVLPTHAWRFWTTLSAFPVGFQKAARLSLSLARRARSLPRKIVGLLAAPFVALGYIFGPFVQGRHGERGNVFSELWLFHPRWWRANFRANGFEIIADEPIGLFYTGHFLLGPLSSFERRARWSRRLGSACHLFKLRVAAGAPDDAGRTPAA